MTRPQATARLNAALEGRYAVERELGAGGMATVYLAEDLRHHRRVAIKVLREDVTDVVGAERFLNEIEIAAGLTHPHIVPVLDSGRAGGLLYYVMPFVEGPTLKERLEREGELAIEDAVRIAREIGDALAYAHGQGVVHRDVKPANILVEAGHAVLSDFGIAQALSEADQTRLTTAGVSLGTPSYMSPEQASGDHEIDGRSDLYSLGCVVYEMLAGEPPYTGRTVHAVLARKLTEPMPGLRSVRETVPEALEHATRRALARLPADRYRTVSEFVEALGEQDRGRPPRRWRSLAPFALLPAMVIVALAAAVVVANTRSNRARGLPVDVVAVFPFRDMTGDTAAGYGLYAAHAIESGLDWMDDVQVIERGTLLQGVRRGAGGVSELEVAAELGAGTAVTGVVTRVGDTLEFRAQVTDVASRRVIQDVVPSGGQPGDLSAIVELLTDRVMGVMAMTLGEPSTTMWFSRPPAHDAYQAFDRGMERWMHMDFQGALADFREAYSLDTTFASPLFMMSTLYGELGQPAREDSVVSILEARRAGLPPSSQIWVAWSRARLAGDRMARLEASRVGFRVNPVQAVRLLVMDAVWAGRPEEALVVWREADEDLRSVLRGWPANLRVLASAQHMTGRFEDQLDLAREAGRLFPDNLSSRYHEAQALAALGRLDEAASVIDQVERVESFEGSTPGYVLLRVAGDLARHGHAVQASDAARRAVLWYRARDPLEHRPELARTLLLADLPEEAAEVLDEEAPQEEGEIETRGLLGVALARSGDRSGAEAQAEWLEALERPYLRGEHTYWRAAISAHLGERDEATRLLRRALEQGWTFEFLHSDPSFEPLWGYELFERVIAPRG
ncbi:MAG: tetratricopeptide repeat-containing serine/threonine-protein kinase [Gemmatimonadota bacterium]|nr:tetratricopeptide repeat-containing serine/threonine-protein kinase [Gemmatimonadota bacterium]